MKKIFITVLCILIVVGILAPFVNGIIMERVVKQNHSDINQIYSETGSDVTLEILQYKRNFRSSDIVWKLNLGNMKNLYGVEEIIFVDHAKHGFASVVSTTSLDQNEWFQSFIKNNMGGKNPLKITTIYGLSGTIQSTIDLDSFSLEIEEETIDIKPGTFVIECEPGFEKLTSHAVWDGMNVADEFAIDQITMDYDLKKISSYIWDGSVTYKIENIMGKETDTTFEINELKGRYFMDYEENTLSTGIEAGFDSLASQNITIDKAFVKIDINNLDSAGYEEFMKIYTHTIYSALDDITAAEDDPEKMKGVMDQQIAGAGLQVLSAYEKFLKKDLELKISGLNAKLPSGKVKGEMSVKLKKDVTFAQLAPIMGQPSLALDIISLDSELSFPSELAKNNPMLTAPLYPGMKTGFFVQDDKKLVHKAETKDNKLFLNDMEVMFE